MLSSPVSIFRSKISNELTKVELLLEVNGRELIFFRNPTTDPPCAGYFQCLRPWRRESLWLAPPGWLPPFWPPMGTRENQPTGASGESPACAPAPRSPGLRVHAHPETHWVEQQRGKGGNSPTANLWPPTFAHHSRFYFSLPFSLFSTGICQFGSQGRTPHSPGVLPFQRWWACRSRDWGIDAPWKGTPHEICEIDAGSNWDWTQKCKLTSPETWNCSTLIEIEHLAFDGILGAWLTPELEWGERTSIHDPVTEHRVSLTFQTWFPSLYKLFLAA